MRSLVSFSYLCTAFAPVSALSAVAALSSVMIASPLAAQELSQEAPPTGPEPTVLNDIFVRGRGDVLLGIADSGSEGTVGSAELAARPLARPGEVLETVPGMIITQHAGGGKANQYYMRGFNLDHGTDFATYVDGVPINMVTHAHGQGYTDINWLIPELIQGVHYEKGPFYAEYGDFANVGAAEIKYFDVLPRNMAELQIGTLGFQRGLLAGSTAVGTGHILYAFEGQHYDGAWDVKNDYRKANGLLKWSDGNENSGYSITAQAYHGIWDANDQVPQRAISAHLVGRYGSLDPTVGGQTERSSVYGEWHRRSDDSATKLLVYGVRYYLDLFSNFTYFIDQKFGDQLEQNDHRTIGGMRLSHAVYGHFMGKDTENTVGLDGRRDDMTLGLDHTESRQLVNNVREDHVTETNIAPWVQNKTAWSQHFRTIVGVRADYFDFHNHAESLSVNSGNKTAGALSPKVSLIFGPWANTEYYLQGGLGIRSNDARGILDKRTPDDAATSRPLEPVVRSRGAELGVRTNALADLNTTLSLWTLETDSETVFDGDSGAVTDTGRPGRRVGVEWTNFYRPLRWLSLDADLSLSQAKFIDSRPEGNNIPDAIRTMVAAGVVVQQLQAVPDATASLRYRYFGPRLLTPSGDEKSGPSTVLNGLLGYNLTHNLTASVEILNVLNTRYNDAEYYDESRLKGEAAGPLADGGTNDHMVHAGEPRSVRAGLTGYF